MGMFDSFYFKDGILPDNKVPEDYEFQTKDLDCDLDRYYVDSNGRVNKMQFWDGKEELDPTPINCHAYVYSHEWLEKGYKYQEYAITIIGNYVTHVKKISESGYDVDKDPQK